MVSELTRFKALAERLRCLRSDLASAIRGQDHVLDQVVPVLQRGELGLSDPRRPKGSFLFVGPTGVGKTELTNCFTAHLFGQEKPVRFDMSEYQLQKSVDKLIGETADDPGLLGRALRDKTRGTLLFDEVEKAHPLVLDLFLQVLEDGRITLATGEVLDLRGFYVVLTSNIGSAEAMRMESAPFASIARTVLMRVGQQLRPEFVGRITEKIVFARLTYDTQREVCERMIAEEIRRLAALGHEIEVTPQAIELLVRQGYHRTLGARPMRGAVERQLQGALADALLAGNESVRMAAADVRQERLFLVPKHRKNLTDGELTLR